MNLIFSYKVINGRKCGFPDNALEKVLKKLEQYQISYQIIYDNDKPFYKDFKKQNKYEYFFNESLFLIDKQNQIDMIIEKITKANINELEKIMKVIYNVSDK